MAGSSKERWYLYSQVEKQADGSEAWIMYGTNGPLVKPPTKAPAGGTIERSGDGNWLTVYRPGRKGEPPGQHPIRVLVRIDPRSFG